MEELLQQILQECRPYTGQGALASYIPELARQDPDRLGIAVFHKDGNMVEAGDSRRCFTIQSVMKPLLLLLALQETAGRPSGPMWGWRPPASPLTPSTWRTTPCWPST